LIALTVECRIFNERWSYPQYDRTTAGFLRVAIAGFEGGGRGRQVVALSGR
jgi:hypothetical protein